MGCIFRGNFPGGRLHPPCPISRTPTSPPLRSTMVNSPGTQTDKTSMTPRWSTELAPYLLQGGSPSGEGVAAVQLITAVRRPLQGRKEWSVMAGHTGSSSLCPGPPGTVPPCCSRASKKSCSAVFEAKSFCTSRSHLASPSATWRWPVGVCVGKANSFPTT